MHHELLLSLATIPVFYTEQMVADAASYSPSATKPRAVVAAWEALGLPITRMEPAPVSPAQLALAHDADYVTQVLTCQAENGFGNRLPAVAQSLPYTSGAMLAAAREALRNGRVAVAPCAGFHHAGYRHGGGFCTFNGLMVTAMNLLKEMQLDRIGILDLDQHWGNGTQDIMEQFGVKQHIRHYHPTLDFRGSPDAAHFLAALPGKVADFADCDLVLYQAGADPHIADPLGGWLSTTQLQQRDRLVFEGLAALRVPVAWNLAGGYQRDKNGSIRPVLEIHENTLRECVRVYVNKNAADDPQANPVLALQAT
ncbi:MAG: hypothetical protein ACOYNF_14210 [Rhodoferax sp.]